VRLKNSFGKRFRTCAVIDKRTRSLPDERKL
jgi:hypothetical protein